MFPIATEELLEADCDGVGKPPFEEIILLDSDEVDIIEEKIMSGENRKNNFPGISRGNNYVLYNNNYTAKLSPQPQLRLALGLLKWNPLPFSPSEKSSVVSQRYKKLFRSVTSLTPWSSKTWSRGCASLSKSSL